MNTMTRAQLAELRTTLGPANPASPDAVRDLLTWHRRTEPRDEVRYFRLVVPTVVKRLLLAETERTTLRTTIARLVIANQHGDDYSLADLAFELQQAGIDLKDDYAAADALADAAEREGLL
ncbi:hypothetical protein [Streptomyces sp. NPDC047028]|uniref:hypothetical protein n=1 Tax=Streptomyces sp. NPDC047028 TaxID=3155793 RepID=UPI0033F420AC